MDAIHQYLDEIRNLSSQKEQLANELEDENELLKSETAQIRLENEALLTQIQLVTKLTSNIEGLQRQLTGKTIAEQIEVFLEERSDNITKLEELQNELQAVHDSKYSLQQQLTKMQTSLEKEKAKNQAIVQKSTEAEQKHTKSLEDLKKSHDKEKFEQEEIKCINENSAATAKQHQIELQKAKDTTQGQKI